jgi:[ribosomal protein S18]-alanine N-acetyltransferase
MATSEPWITLRRDFDSCLAALTDPARETYVGLSDGTVVGLLLLNMRGAFVGYIQSVGVREDWRGRGVGTQLLVFAEQRIFRDSPNAFICASSFNPRARMLYERLGYEVVGELRDYIVRGCSEWLLRKSIGPLVEFGQT